MTPRRTLLASAVIVATLVARSEGRQQSVFRSAASGVSVEVSVRNGNQPVTGLRASDFTLYDGDTRQTIDSVTVDAVPVDATLFLGTNNQTASRSLAGLNVDIKAIAALLRPDDRVRLLTLENQVTDVFGWRSNRAPETAMGVHVGGVQSLYDACFVAMMHRPDPGRRHLIIAITDGVEFGSIVDSTIVRDVARRAEAVFHLVLVDPVNASSATMPAPPANTPLIRAPLRSPPPLETIPGTDSAYLRATWFHVMADEHGIDRLQEAAQLTGGTVRRGSSGESVVQSFKKAFDDFRQSYILRYTAQGVPPSGWHDLRVEVAGGKKYVVRARKGYFGG